MIFYDLILALKDGVAAAVDDLFGAAYANQTHSQDLLLIDQHGSYSEMLADLRVRGAHHLSPYVIGPDLIGFAEATFYQFTDWYRQSHQLDKAEFEELIKHDEETQKQEHLMLQIEQSIYLRFWEADMILKQLYQLSSLASGEAYDWHLQMPVHARARGESKHEIIRKKIRNRVETICPAFYALVKENYKSQIRNAIAHSQFWIGGRSIVFLNHSRFWEADMILKQLYQLSSLASGEAYDWHLQMPVHARARGESKHEIIRKKIRNRVETICPAFYALVKENYKSQIRNAIAHSQFWIGGRSIVFLNHSDDPAAYAPLKGMNFDEWYETFHTTLLLHSEIIRAFKQYRSKYRERTLANGNRIEIRIVMEDGSESLNDLGVLHDRDVWIWHKNLNDEDLRQKVG